MRQRLRDLNGGWAALVTGPVAEVDLHGIFQELENAVCATGSEAWGSRLLSERSVLFGGEHGPYGLLMWHLATSVLREVEEAQGNQGDASEALAAFHARLKETAWRKREEAQDDLRQFELEGREDEAQLKFLEKRERFYGYLRLEVVKTTKRQASLFGPRRSSVGIPMQKLNEKLHNASQALLHATRHDREGAYSALTALEAERAAASARLWKHRELHMKWAQVGFLMLHNSDYDAAVRLRRWLSDVY